MTSEIHCPDWDNEKQKLSESYKRNLNAVSSTAVNSARRGEQFETTNIKRYHDRINRDHLPAKCPKYYVGNFRQVNPEMPCLNTDVRVGSAKGLPAAKVSEAVHFIINEYESNFQIIQRLTTPSVKIERIAFSTAVLIGKFIRVHPFLNGNGTISRLLIRCALMRFNYTFDMRLTPRPDGDYARLMSECMRENYKPLAAFILKTISARPTS